MNKVSSAMQIVSIVGMAGSGKSEVAAVFEKRGYAKVRFGDITSEEIKKGGLDTNERNERNIRQQLREEHGMAAYARLSIPKIDDLLKSSNVVIDGLYSWEEYTLLKDHYSDTLIVIAVWSSPATRYKRLASRPVRPLTLEEAVSRDNAEIENINKGGPIAMADITIINEHSIKNLEAETRIIIGLLK